MASMVETGCWYGVLEAGGKSTPVARDPALDTGKPDTIYLFNFNRKVILEYRRDIVEGKLRDLNGDELQIAEALEEAFRDARQGFTPRRALRSASSSKRRAKVETEEAEEEEADFEVDVPLPQGDTGEHAVLDPVDEAADDDDDDDE